MNGLDDIMVLEDPDKRYQCRVCAIMIPTNHLNYGALTCYSCRAFFRRVVVRKRKNKLVCHFNADGCVINPENRSSCRKCRYDKCLAVGMKPDLVLNEDQKKARFKKANFEARKANKDKGKKAKAPKKSKSEDSSDDSPDERDVPPAIEPKIEPIDLDAVPKLEPMTPACSPPDLLPLTPFNNGHMANTIPVVKQEVSSQDEGDDDIDRILELACEVAEVAGESSLPEVHISENDLKVEDAIALPSAASILETPGTFKPWLKGPTPMPQPLDTTTLGHKKLSLQFCFGAIANSFQLDNDFKLSLACTIPGGRALNKHMFTAYLSNLARVFKGFADNYPDFSALSIADKSTLLANGTPLFLAFIVGNVLTCYPNRETQQASWFSLRQDPDFACSLSCDELNLAVGLFRSDSALVSFRTLISKMALFDFPFSKIHVVAHACLFDPFVISSNRFDNQGAIYGFSQEIPYHMQGLACDGAMLMETCMELATLMQSNASFNPDHVLAKSLIMGFTTEEQNALDRKVRELANVFSQVSVGEHLTRDALGFVLFDEPLSRSTWNRAKVVMLERFRRLLANHAEFNSISAGDQMQLMAMNMANAIGVIAIKQDTCTNLAQQALIYFGTDDLQIINNMMGKLAKTTHVVRPIRMDNMNRSSKLVSMASEGEFYSLLKCIPDFMGNLQTFTLFLQFILFANCNQIFSDDHPLAKLSYWYKIMLARKVESEGVMTMSQLDYVYTLVKKVSTILHENLFC